MKYFQCEQPMPNTLKISDFLQSNIIYNKNNVKHHEPKQINNQTPWGCVQPPAEVSSCYRLSSLSDTVIWMKLPKKANLDEAQAF